VRGRSVDDRLEALSRRLEALGAQESRLPVRRELADNEVLEIALVMLQHVYGGDAGAFSGYLMGECGLPFEEAEQIARDLAELAKSRA
jgi:hypothetical protein